MQAVVLSLLLVTAGRESVVPRGGAGAVNGEVEKEVARLGSPDPVVRRHAEKALLAIGAPAIESVLEVAAKGNLVEADGARRLLPMFGPANLAPLMQAARIDLGLIHTREWREAVNAAAKMGASVLPKVVRMIEKEDPFLSRFAFAAEVLATMGPESTDSLIPLLDYPKSEVRKAAARILVGQRDPGVRVAFLRALHNEDGGVRMYSARGLGWFDDEEVKTALLNSLRDSDWGPRRAAAAALGKMYEPRFREALAKMARDEDDALIRDTASTVLVHQSRDPVGQHLGRRYAPYAISPAEKLREHGHYAVLLVGTFGLLAACSALSAARGRLRYSWLVVLFLILLCAGAGWVWGYELAKVSGHLEALLTKVVVPAVACCGLVVAFIARRRGGAVSVLARWMAPLLAFETAYWLGWLKLWGRL